MAENTERPEDEVQQPARRHCIVPVHFQRLAHLLMLPKDSVVLGAHVDPLNDQVYLKVESPHLSALAPGMPPPMVIPIYRNTHDEDGGIKKIELVKFGAYELKEDEPAPQSREPKVLNNEYCPHCGKKFVEFSSQRNLESGDYIAMRRCANGHSWKRTEGEIEQHEPRQAKRVEESVTLCPECDLPHVEEFQSDVGERFFVEMRACSNGHRWRKDGKPLPEVNPATAVLEAGSE